MSEWSNGRNEGDGHDAWNNVSGRLAFRGRLSVVFSGFDYPKHNECTDGPWLTSSNVYIDKYNSLHDPNSGQVELGYELTNA